MLGRNVDRRQRDRSRVPEAVCGDVLGDLRALDGLVVNLECCLSTRGEQWTRTDRPFHFRADPEWAVPALEATGVSCVALANNHVLDFEVPALVDTLDALDGASVARAGAGRDAAEARRPATFEADGLDVGLPSLTGNTPEYAAGPDSPGTARVEIDREDPVTRAVVADALDALGDEPDLVVASLHWGPNTREYPPTTFREFARWLVDSGVDVVHGHSAHVFQGVEVYDGRPVLYDTGDFVDDYAVDVDLHNDRGLLIELVVVDGEPSRLERHPTVVKDCATTYASGDVARWCRETMRERSEPFATTFERNGDSLVVTFD
jgi:poly-gamma-glutamate synthesis protein (capsule biosynthesis protein)